MNRPEIWQSARESKTDWLEAVGRRLVTADRGHRGRADRRTGQAEVEWNAKKERDEAAGERVGGSGRPTEARGAPIANGTDGTNARVASLFPPANRVKSPCPPRSGDQP